MSTIRISEEKVIAAAKAVLSQGYEPTLASVRKYLGGSGSQTTIHKYLKAWKLKGLRLYSHCNTNGSHSSQIIEEKKIVEHKLSEALLHNEQYAQALIHSKKTAILTQQKNEELQKKLLNIEERLKEEHHLRYHFENLYKEIQADRETFINQELNEKNRLITLLQDELKIVNENAFNEVKSLSYFKDDALMQEKVKIINLQEKIIKLTEDNRKAQNDNNSLRYSKQKIHNKLKQLESLLQEHLNEDIKQQYLIDSESFE